MANQLPRVVFLADENRLDCDCERDVSFTCEQLPEGGYLYECQECGQQYHSDHHFTQAENLE